MEPFKAMKSHKKRVSENGIKIHHQKIGTKTFSLERFLDIFWL